MTYAQILITSKDRVSHPVDREEKVELQLGNSLNLYKMNVSDLALDPKTHADMKTSLEAYGSTSKNISSVSSMTGEEKESIYGQFGGATKI